MPVSMAEPPDDSNSQHDSSEDEEEPIAINGNGRVRNAQGKRLRTDDEIEDEMGDGNSQDEFSQHNGERDITSDAQTRDARRSTGKARRTSSVHEHQPGSIVRILVKNFVTYTSASFYPGPALNMVIGPNGTGKSTLVCAICLGLGWGTQHLGRAKDLGEFVKHGCAKATIEIELKGNPGETNPVVRRQIVRDGNKSTFRLNGQAVTNKKVVDLMRGFNIQIDNLCQFLPQDRVVEFAQLDPKELLVKTQQAAAPAYMLEWHDHLSRIRAEQKQKEQEQDVIKTTLASLEAKQNLQRADVVRLRERKEITHKISMLEASRPFPEYAAAKEQHDKNTVLKRQAQQDLEDLRLEVEPSLRALNGKEEYGKQYEEALTAKRRILKRLEEQGDEMIRKRTAVQRDVDDCDKKVESEAQGNRTRINDIARIRQTIISISKRMEEEPIEFDAAAYNERIRAKEREIRTLEQNSKDVKLEYRDKEQEIVQKERKVADAQRTLENLRSQAGQQSNKLQNMSRETAEAWAWIQANRNNFRGPVYGPPMLECTVQDKRYVDNIESSMQQNHFTAITCTTQADFQTLNKQIFRTMGLHDVSLRTVTKTQDHYPPPATDEEMRHIGIDGWAIDYLTGPAPVLTMLCEEARLNRIGVCLNEMSEAQYEAFERSDIDTCATNKSVFKVTKRREYGAGATSTTVREVRRAQVWTSQPVDTMAENDARDNIAGWQSEIEEMKNQQERLRERVKALQRQVTELTAERDAITDEKAAKQKASGEYQALPNKLAIQQKKLADLHTSEEQTKERVRTIRKDQIDFVMKKGQYALDHAKLTVSMREKLLDLAHTAVVAIEAQSDIDTLMERNDTVRRELKEKEDEFNELVRKHTDFRNQTRLIARKIQDLRDTNPQVVEFWQSLSEDERKRTPREHDDELDSLRSRLESLHEGNPRAIVEYEERARHIETSQAQLATLEASLATYTTSISTLRAKWEPELEALMSRVSDAFAASFEKINCAGAVSIHKAGDDGQDFASWQAQVQVRFREHEQLSVLDSHRQSGGERAVSTIFYLMALQGLSRAPFRVVDEINQGMDPRNERIVHERMVDIACGREGEGGGSQYFLITPKLLSGLKYSPGMKVHCIASGEFMPTDCRELDFKALLARARAAREVAAAA